MSDPRDAHRTPEAHPLLPEGILRGIELFNAGEYYEAHEVMETAWRAWPGDERLFFQGLIQAAVALWRVDRGNATIALTMCSRGLPKLAQFRPAFAGIDVEALYHDLHWVRDQVLSLGEQHIAQFDKAQFPKIRFIVTDGSR